MTMVVKNITWPHEMVYSSAGKPTAYQELSVYTFVQGYLVVMCAHDIKKGYYGLPPRRSDVWLRPLWVRNGKGLSWGRAQSDGAGPPQLLQGISVALPYAPTVPSSAQPAPSYTSSGPWRFHQTAGGIQCSSQAVHCSM